MQEERKRHKKKKIKMCCGNLSNCIQLYICTTVIRLTKIFSDFYL